MPKSVTEIAVLIASPNDLKDTRAFVRDTINTWNDNQGKDRTVRLAPRMWESHAAPVLGERPQGVINRQVVDPSDIAVALLWHRFGTPTGEAASGTAEEIERLVEHGKHVSVYFCEAPYPPDVDTAQLETLRAYRKSWEPRGLVWTYTTEGQLREQLLRHLTQHVDEITSAPDDGVSTPPAPVPALSVPGDGAAPTHAPAPGPPGAGSDAVALAGAGRIDDALKRVREEHPEAETDGTLPDREAGALWAGFVATGNGAAFQRLEQLARDNAGRPAVEYAYGAALTRLERHDEAFAAAERVAAPSEVARGAPDAIRFAALALAKRGRVGEALGLVGRRRRAEADLRTRAELTRIAADLFKDAPGVEDPVTRLSLVEYALRDTPEDNDARNALAYEYLERKANAPALFRYEELLARNPALGGAENNAGVTAQTIGLKAASVDHFRKAETLGVTLAMANLGTRFANEGMLAEAEALVEKARALADVHENVGRLAAAIIQRRDAEKAARDALKRTFDTVTALRVQFATALLAEPLPPADASGRYVGAPTEANVAVDANGHVTGIYVRSAGVVANLTGVVRGRAAMVTWADAAPTPAPQPAGSAPAPATAPAPAATGHGLLIFGEGRVDGYTAAGANAVDASTLPGLLQWSARRASAEPGPG